MTLARVLVAVDGSPTRMGSRGVGADLRMVLGSTSTQVAQRSDRPVAIVPGC